MMICYGVTANITHFRFLPISPLIFATVQKFTLDYLRDRQIQTPPCEWSWVVMVPLLGTTLEVEDSPGMVCDRTSQQSIFPLNGLKMEIVFKRRLTNELLTTYLPSFLLVLMCYATSFFKPIYFEAAVTVNLSILLVTTTLFIRSPSTPCLESPQPQVSYPRAGSPTPSLIHMVELEFVGLLNNPRQIFAQLQKL